MEAHTGHPKSSVPLVPMSVSIHRFGKVSDWTLGFPTKLQAELGLMNISKGFTASIYRF